MAAVPLPATVAVTRSRLAAAVKTFLSLAVGRPFPSQLERDPLVQQPNLNIRFMFVRRDPGYRNRASSTAKLLQDVTGR